IQAEQSVLGGMLLSKDAITQVVEIIHATDFYRPAHQIVYEAIIDLFSRGEPVDAISVNAELTKRGEATRVGGALYLHTLTEAIPTAANAGYYAKIVADRAVLRRLVEVGTRIAQIGYSGEGDVNDLVDLAHQELSQVENMAASGGELVHASQVYQEVVDDQDTKDDQVLVTPPYADLREIVPAIKPGQLTIVGARPGVGKSVVAADFARHTAMHHGIGTVFFSLEMTRLELGQRVMAAEAG